MGDCLLTGLLLKVVISQGQSSVYETCILSLCYLCVTQINVSAKIMLFAQLIKQMDVIIKISN